MSRVSFFCDVDDVCYHFITSKPRPRWRNVALLVVYRTERQSVVYSTEQRPVTYITEHRPMVYEAKWRPVMLAMRHAVFSAPRRRRGAELIEFCYAVGLNQSEMINIRRWDWLDKMDNSDVTAAIEGHPERRILANRIDAQAAASMPILTGHCQRMTTCACVAGVALRKNRLDVHVRDIHVDVHVPTCNVILTQRPHEGWHKSSAT